MKFIIDPNPLDSPDPVPPPEGWHKPCGFADHSWVLEVEEGRAHIRATECCDPELVDPSGPSPTCAVFWEPEDLNTVEPIPINVELINDSTASTPAGPAEYSFYIDLRPVSALEEVDRP